MSFTGHSQGRAADAARLSGEMAGGSFKRGRGRRGVEGSGPRLTCTVVQAHR